VDQATEGLVLRLARVLTVPFPRDNTCVFLFPQPMFQVFGNGPQRGRCQNTPTLVQFYCGYVLSPGAQRPANQQVREEEQRLAQIFITIAVLVVIVILFA